LRTANFNSAASEIDRCMVPTLDIGETNHEFTFRQRQFFGEASSVGAKTEEASMFYWGTDG
jgi:hypothetical protein